MISLYQIPVPTQNATPSALFPPLSPDPIQFILRDTMMHYVNRHFLMGGFYPHQMVCVCTRRPDTEMDVPVVISHWLFAPHSSSPGATR